MRANETVRLSDSDEFRSTSMKPVAALAGYEDVKTWRVTHTVAARNIES